VNPFEIAGNGIDDDGNGYVDDVNGYDFANDRANVFENAATDWHGTHVAGTIGAVGNNSIGVSGVAWNVKLMSLKFLSARSGSSDNAIRAIKYVIDMKRRGVNVKIINASWSGPNGARTLRRAIRKAGLEGVLFVCAAGNGGDDNRGDDIDLDEETQYPAAWSAELDTVISVAALDSRDQLPSFSNYGHRRVTVAAPGVGVLSTYPGGGYTLSSGTSMATPHVSGIAALVWSHYPTISPAIVKKRLYETVEQVLPLASKAKSPGRVNAFNALMARVPLPHWTPKIRAVTTTGRRVIIDGLGLMRGSTVVEVNGVGLTFPRFDERDMLADGTFTRMVVKVSRADMDALFPGGRAAQVVVFNPSSNERSTAFDYTRR
jgi:subtilisin family serine protease